MESEGFIGPKLTFVLVDRHDHVVTQYTGHYPGPPNAVVYTDAKLYDYVGSGGAGLYKFKEREK